MPKVLIVSAADLAPQLGRTLLWRSDIERIFAPETDSAFELARSITPKLVLLDGGPMQANLHLIRRLREDPMTRSASIAVLNRTKAVANDEDQNRIAALSDEEALRRAGANVVLSGPVDAFVWDCRLDELLNVPRRRETRIDARYGLWPTVVRGMETVTAQIFNLSERGMLLEGDVPIEVGAQLDLSFTLPDHGEELRVVGQVVRGAASDSERQRVGIEFLILRGNARERIRAFIEAEARP